MPLTLDPQALSPSASTSVPAGNPFRDPNWGHLPPKLRIAPSHRDNPITVRLNLHFVYYGYQLESAPFKAAVVVHVVQTRPPFLLGNLCILCSFQGLQT